LGEGLEPGAVRLEVLPLGVELIGKLLPLDLETGDAVGFGFEAFDGGGGGCFSAGVGGSEVGEFAVCVLEAGEVLAEAPEGLERVVDLGHLRWHPAAQPVAICSALMSGRTGIGWGGASA
jgi:hypothetical protein